MQSPRAAGNKNRNDLIRALDDLRADLDKFHMHMLYVALSAKDFEAKAERDSGSTLLETLDQMIKNLKRSKATINNEQVTEIKEVLQEIVELMDETASKYKQYKEAGGNLSRLNEGSDFLQLIRSVEARIRDTKKIAPLTELIDRLTKLNQTIHDFVITRENKAVIDQLPEMIQQLKNTTDRTHDPLERVHVMLDKLPQILQEYREQEEKSNRSIEDDIAFRKTTKDIDEAEKLIGEAQAIVLDLTQDTIEARRRVESYDEKITESLLRKVYEEPKPQPAPVVTQAAPIEPKVEIKSPPPAVEAKSPATIESTIEPKVEIKSPSPAVEAKSPATAESTSEIKATVATDTTNRTFKDFADALKAKSSIWRETGDSKSISPARKVKAWFDKKREHIPDTIDSVILAASSRKSDFEIASSILTAILNGSPSKLKKANNELKNKGNDIAKIEPRYQLYILLNNVLSPRIVDLQDPQNKNKRALLQEIHKELQSGITKIENNFQHFQRNQNEIKASPSNKL